MTGTITNRQMVFILFLTLTTVTVISLPKLIAQKAGTGGWITLLIAALLFALAVVVIVRLNLLFPGRVLADYSRDLVGRGGSGILSVLYILYFLAVSGYLVSSWAHLLKSDFLIKTPEWADMLVGIPVICWAAYRGVTNIARLFEIYGVILLVVALFAHVLMLTQGSLMNILPVVGPSGLSRPLSALGDVVPSFLGIEVLLVIPFTQANKKAPKIAFFTLLLIGFYYVLIVESCIAMMGMEETVLHSDAMVQALRQVDASFLEFMRRLDIMFLTAGFMGVFAGITVAFTAALEYACRLLPRIPRVWVVVCLGAFLFALGLLAGALKAPDEAFGVFGLCAGLPAAVLIPLVLYCIAKVKRREKKVS
jgi:spore germination protein